MDRPQIPSDWEELPTVIIGADVFLVAGKTRLQRARYMSCRIYIIGGVLDDVMEFDAQLYECEIAMHSPWNPWNLPPPREGFVGSRGGKVVSLRQVKDGD